MTGAAPPLAGHAGVGGSSRDACAQQYLRGDKGAGRPLPASAPWRPEDPAPPRPRAARFHISVL